MSEATIYNSTMKRLNGRIIKQKFMGFDVETYGKENTFYSGGLWWEENGKKYWKYFKDAEKMRNWIIRKCNTEYTIVATNLSFDFTVLFWDTDYWNDFKIIMRGSKIMLCEYKFKSRNGCIKFIDTMNYIPFSVEKLGKIVGIEKLESPSFWEYGEDGNIICARKPTTYYEGQELEIYNRQDCKISAKFMEFLQTGINKLGGNLRITAASTSLDVWRRNYQPIDMIKEEFILDDENIKQFIYKAYYGGRTECFKRGKIENVNYYDINSLYPAVMRLEYPKPDSVHRPHKPKVKNILYDEGVSTCTVYCPDLKIPLLPYRHDNKLKFPTGIFKGTWNHNELRKALDLGYEIIEVHEQIIYTKTFNPFKKFVETHYELRQEYKSEDSNMQLVVKLLMNSLYGKFAQRHLQDYKVVDEEHLSVEDFERLSKGEYEFDFIDGKVVMKKDKVCNSIFTFPILSSYVTSYARILMYNYAVKYEAYYMDTDSIITNHEFPSSNELGEMELEKRIDEGIIIKPKLYMINDKVKAKGIKSPNKQDFIDILEGNKVIKDKFSSLRESIRRHLVPNTILEVSKELNLEDDKRIWSEKFNPNKLQDSEPIKITKEDWLSIEHE